MRADRLIAALMVLQTRGRITAAELADELEISTRTARRDLEALAMSGVPVYSMPGRGGGWMLVGGAKTDLTGLSAAEARALFFALGHQSESDRVLEAALRKLVVALPERFRTDALAAANAIRVDPSGWDKVGSVETPPVVAELSAAVISGHQVQIRYARPDSEPADRVVHPLGLVTKRGVWYLVANTDRGIRTFRISRVHAVEALDAPVERPPDFDLDTTWASIVSEVAEKRTGITVQAKVVPGALVPLRWIFAGRIEVRGEADDGRLDVAIREASAAALAAQLAGFGAGVEINDPPDELRAEFHRITSELADRWM